MKCVSKLSENLFRFVLSMLVLESADSIRFLYRHFLLKITEKSLNAFYQPALCKGELYRLHERHRLPGPEAMCRSGWTPGPSSCVLMTHGSQIRLEYFGRYANCIAITKYDEHVPHYSFLLP